MDNNGQEKPQVATATQQPSTFTQLACPKCQKQMAVRMPHTSVFNSLSVSAVTFSHERVDRCASCNASFIPVVAGITPEAVVVFRWTEVEIKPPSIVAPTQSNMAQAVDLDKITKGMKKQ